MAVEFHAIFEQANRGTWCWGPDVRNRGIVFEGAQGVLLDEWVGFHPYTTWSTTTAKNADTLAAEVGLPRPFRLGVTRSYDVRHGPGPFPTEDLSMMRFDPNNSYDDWRGAPRYGALDLVLLRYAADAMGGVDGLAVTHLDQWPGRWVDVLDGPTGVITRIPVRGSRDLRRQEAIGRCLLHAVPANTLVTHRLPLASMSTATASTVFVTSTGPTAEDRQELVPLPNTVLA